MGWFRLLKNVIFIILLIKFLNQEKCFQFSNWSSCPLFFILHLIWWLVGWSSPNSLIGEDQNFIHHLSMVWSNLHQFHWNSSFRKFVSTVTVAVVVRPNSICRSLISRFCLVSCNRNHFSARVKRDVTTDWENQKRKNLRKIQNWRANQHWKLQRY